MNKKHISAILAVTALTFSVGAPAQGMTRNEYKAVEKNIVADYKSARAKCDSFAANAKDICLAEAKGNSRVAKAELAARYKPSRKSSYRVSVAKADADYAVAREKCDDHAGNVKDVCVKEAKAALVAARSDAMAQLKTSNANAMARMESSVARMKAKEKGNEARHDAAVDKVEADYAVAREKCNAMSGDAKEHCMNDAKVYYGK